MDDSNIRRQEDWERSLSAWKSKRNKGMPLYNPISYNPMPKAPHEENTLLTKFLIFLAFAIPIAILGYALYINYLPFGYSQEYSLMVDENGVISPLSNEIYLTTPQGRKLLSLPGGVKGQVNLVLEPNVVLKDATAEVSIEGEGVYLSTAPNLSEIEWNYDWDFSLKIPKDFDGTATYDSEQKCAYFNAYNEQTLSMPNSKDLFEYGPMSIYVKWKPSHVSRILGERQQIIGHFNWELFQKLDSIEFRVGRMNDANGTFYSISYPISLDLFDSEHTALAIYDPNSDDRGYIELWVDNNLAGRTFIGTDVIYEDYNSQRDLSFGWNDYGYAKNPYFDGCLYSTKIIDEAIVEERTQGLLESINNNAIIPIIGNGNITSVRVMVSK